MRCTIRQACAHGGAALYHQICCLSMSVQAQLTCPWAGMGSGQRGLGLQRPHPVERRVLWAASGTVRIYAVGWARAVDS